MRNIILDKFGIYEKMQLRRCPDMKDKDLVRKMRKGHGLTLAVLAKETGISLPKLSRWEHDKAKLTPEEVEKVMAAIDRAVIRQAESVPGPLADHGGGAVKRLRRLYGINQLELAKRAGIAQSVISLFENAYADFEPEELQALEVALNSLIEEKKSSLPASVSLQSLLTLGKKPHAKQSAEKGLQQLRELQQKQIANLEKQCLDLEEIATLRHVQIEGLKRKLFSLGVTPEEVEELLEEPEVVREHAGD